MPVAHLRQIPYIKDLYYYLNICKVIILCGMFFCNTHIFNFKNNYIRLLYNIV